jgi:predicted chitinase
MLSDVQLRQIMPNLAPAKLALYLPALNRAMQDYGVNTMLRTAAFIAQLAHESGEFRWMEEIWGPTDAQRRYEPASDLAARLGNTQPGDGKLFKGRGPIQITGRFNYHKYGGLLGIDLNANPALAATPDVAFATAGLYWKTNGLNELADAEQFVTITRRINGGTNGLADRQKFYETAKAVLARGFTAGAATRGARTVALPDGPLTRGHEAIREIGAVAVKKRAAGKAVAVKVAGKKTPARNVAAKQVAAKKVTAKKAAPTTKPAAKKVAVVPKVATKKAPRR